MEVSLLSFISICAGKEWGLSNNQMASITGVVFIGELLGSLFWGPLADHFGRRFAFVIACLLISTAGALSAFAPSYEILLLTRGIVGFGVGGLTVPYDLLAEFLPSSHRGVFLIYVEFFWTLGSLFVAGAAWLLLEDYGWRALAFFTVVPVALSSIFSLMILPESPRWLLLKGHVEEAEEVMRNAAEVGQQPLEPFTLFVPAEHKQPEAEGLLSLLKEYTALVSTADLRAVSFPLWYVWLSFGFSYYGIILLTSRVYSSADTDVSFDFLALFVSASSEFVGVFVTALIVDRWGRVPTQSLMYLFTGVGMALLGLRGNVHFSSFAIGAIAFVSRMSAMSSSSATWVATPELYSTEHRGTGHAICSAGARFGAFFSPYFVVSSLSVEAVGVILGLVNLSTAAVVWLLPETAGMLATLMVLYAM